MEKRFAIPTEVRDAIVELLDKGMGENFIPVNVTLLDDKSSKVVENNVKAYLCKTNVGNSFYYLVDNQKIRAAGKHTLIQGPRLSGTRVSDFATMMIVLVIQGFNPEFINNMVVTDDSDWGPMVFEFIDRFWKKTREVVVSLANIGTLRPGVVPPTPGI